VREPLICFSKLSILMLCSSSAKGSEDRFESLAKLSSPFRKRKSSLLPIGKRSRSPSPASGQVRAPELLARCISVLASIISEDCRFKISSPRLSRPPNALQALTLDVIQFLLHTNRSDPKVISQIGFALIPAFATFPPEMLIRLLAFFEQNIIRAVLEDLKRVQGVDDPVMSFRQEKGACSRVQQSLLR
jgi:hypothetical protein